MTIPNPPQVAGPEPDSANDQELAAQHTRALAPAARRALAEAAARRAEIDRRAAALSGERGGRTGLEPVRYGDWEVKGLASDF